MASQSLHIVARGEGPTVVLLHGLMATGEMYRWLAELLEPRFRLVIPDLPGHGASGHVPGPYTVEAMAEGVAVALQDRDIRDAHVMGYSHGGAVAQCLARNVAVRSLALVATYAHNTESARERVEGWLTPRLVRVLGMRRLAAMVARPGTGGGPPLSPERITWLRELLATNDTAIMARAAAELARFDSRPWLGELTAPTLVVSGGRDTAVPAHHAAMLANGIAGARTATIPDAGHTMVWTHPERLAEILTDWWSR
jgi:3-oxoadipate enol-lactonase